MTGFRCLILTLCSLLLIMNFSCLNGDISVPLPFKKFPYIVVKYALGHLDETCKLKILSRCNWNMNAYCDNDNICRCKDGYIKINPHLCGEPKRFGDKCDDDLVCKHFDGNMTCFEQRCICKRGLYYDHSIRKCSFRKLFYLI